ncbi:hypothetical protein FJY90_07580 [Candidatus Gottesmanbacteria bacterium]|nr:hypothetical protein [Candidatus Gottesmanbacteria bacterium]
MNNTQELTSAKGNTLSSLRVLIVIFAVLALGGGTFYGLTTRSQVPTPPTSPFIPSPTKAVRTSSLAPSASTATLVYGVWEEGKSTVKAVNADGSNNVTIAKLPSNIKDVNIISDRELLYIADTDNRDHGKKVNIYNLVTGQTSTLFEASTGFGIDDIVLSGDKKWVASWEVKFAAGANILSGGDSRVYITNINTPQNKIPIVDEQNVSASNPLRYPLFFDAFGRLFLDTFGPNGGGWNLGLWMVNADGTSLSPVPGMTDGAYSIDPIPSPDGTKIVFTGYDPTAAIQLASQTSGVFRPSIANPNLLQIMDLSNFTKTTLLGSNDGAQYANPVWLDTQQRIVFQKFKVVDSQTSKYEGTYIYDLTSGEITQIASLADKSPLEILKSKGNSLLAGNPAQNTGNLGNNYLSSFVNLFLTDVNTNTISSLISGQTLQYIDYLDKTTGKPLALEVSSATVQSTLAYSLQLKSFEIKPIEAVRGTQQNDKAGLPRCRDLLGMDKKSEWAAAQKAGKCSDSPLYLYPEKETLVIVKVKPPAHILYSELVYSDGWQVLAKPSGQMITHDGRQLNKISYTYLTSPVTQPKSGLVVNKKELKDSLEIYATRLGFSGQEITDFVSFWSQNLPDSPYYFISHFSQEESRSLLPLEINPKPDTLIQTVMYFKPLQESINLSPPSFAEIPQRQGFVAADWSGIVEE